MPAVTGPSPVLCLGCVPGVLVLTHRCAGPAELLPTGGWCECTRPGCGPNPDGRQRLGVGKSTRKA